MAKTVKEERLAIVLELTRSGGTGPVEVSCRADYEVSSDDLTESRNFEPTLSKAQKTTVKNFGTQVLQAIKASEE